MYGYTCSEQSVSRHVIYIYIHGCPPSVLKNLLTCTCVHTAIVGDIHAPICTIHLRRTLTTIVLVLVLTIYINDRHCVDKYVIW